MADTTTYPFLPNSVALPIFAAAAIISNLVPFVALYRVKNLAACTLTAASMLTNFWTCINAIIWSNDNTSSWWDGYGLCDVEVLTRAVLPTLVATSMACLTRSLAQAVDTDNPRLFETLSQRRRRHIGELLFIFGVPFVEMCTHYVYQAGRYGIVTIYGCADVIDYSWPTIVLVLIWPTVFSLLNCYYGVIVTIRLQKHRGRLSSTLLSSGSGFNARKFLKLYFLSVLILIVYTPMTIAFLYFNLPIPLVPYSWSRIHDPAVWDPILLVTTAMYGRLQYYGYAPASMSAIMFLYYGCNNEAIDMYRKFAGKYLFLAKKWPGLLEPRVIQRKGSTTRSSWISHIDIVTKAIHYFDGVRKQSQATTTTTGTTEATRSRKGSAVTFEHMTLAHISTAASTRPTTQHSDFINPLPTVTGPLHRCKEESLSELQAPTPVHQRTIFSAFSTNITLPQFPLFHSKSRTKRDIESQPQPQSYTSARRLSAQLHSLDTTQRTVETSIWSGPSTTPHLQADEDSVNPLTPNLGSRAYRERERRENEALVVRKEKERSRVMADEVVIETAVDIREEPSRSHE